MAENTPATNNMVWLDLEMTGLEVDVDVILEIATIVTDGDLNVLEEGPVFAIHQDDAVLSRMNKWNTDQHTASGLVGRVRQSRVTEAEAEARTLEFVKRHVPAQAAPLCGNSISQDRKFLAKYMRELHDYLHYRNVDVTTVKELVARWYPGGPKMPQKSDAHLALQDIRESIRELSFYRKYFFVAHPETAPAAALKPPG